MSEETREFYLSAPIDEMINEMYEIKSLLKEREDFEQLTEAMAEQGLTATSGFCKRDKPE